MGTGQCNFCATTMEIKNLKRCSNCKVAFHCSKESHKAVCTRLSSNLEDNPNEREGQKQLTRWVEAWSSAMMFCSSIALDLANQKSDRHETHVLFLCIAHTDFTEDARLFRVTSASLEPFAKLVRFDPRFESEAIPPPPEYAGQPRVRCIFYVEDRDDLFKEEFIRVHSCCIADLQGFCSNAEKDYSRAIAKQAIPLLVNDINGFREPQDVTFKFKIMIGVPVEPGIAQPLLDVSDVDIPGDNDGKLFRQRLEQLFNGFG